MKKWARRIISTFALLLVVSYLLGSIDYWRVRKGELPIFVFHWGGFFDGGTNVGLGFGYYVVANHGCKYASEHGKEGNDVYWTNGTELKFCFFPFLDRSELQCKPIKHRS
jgi:hypothetical protein